jgi:signal transduction histidine kinase
MIQSCLLILAAICDTFLAAIALKSNRKSIQKQYFAYFLIFCVIWSIGDALMLFTRSADWIYVGQFLYMQSPLFVTFFILLFAYSYPDEAKISRRPFIVAFLLLSGYSVAIAAKINYFMVLTRISPDTNVITPIQPGYSIYTLYFTIFSLWYVIVLWRKNKSAKGTKKYLLQYFLFAITISTIMAMFSNLLIPNIKGYMQYVWIGPLASLLLATMVSIVIIRHQFLDIRLIVARSIGYILSLGTIAATYSFFLFSIANTLRTNYSQNIQEVFYVAVTMVSVLSYPVIKRWFDKATNHVFYQDAYDPQVFLDRLNKVLVGTIDTEVLLTQSAIVIGDTLRPTFCVFGVKEPNNKLRHIIGDAKVNFDEHTIASLRKMIPATGSKVLITDELDEEDVHLRDSLRKRNIAVLCQLTNSPQGVKAEYGYMVLGSKRSGNPYSRPDIRTLEIITDELTIALQNAILFEEINNFNKTLQDKIDRATKELVRTNDKLKALDKTKDDFVSMASHQLRTPLTSVKGYLSMVLEGDSGKITPLQQNLLQQAYISSQRMVYLITDLLNVSRLKTGRFIIVASPTNLVDVIDGELAQLQDIAKGRGLTLKYNKPKHFSLLMLDESKVRQVIMNFVDNAIYYTPSGGTIKVELTETASSVECLIVDNGMGVPRDEQHSLFTKFYRASNARKARPDGTGLGLYMAKKVVVAQNGAIIFKSREGQGSTFGFSFPKGRLYHDPEHAQTHKVYLTK